MMMHRATAAHAAAMDRVAVLEQYIRLCIECRLAAIRDQLVRHIARWIHSIDRLKAQQFIAGTFLFGMVLDRQRDLVAHRHHTGRRRNAEWAQHKCRR